jgi:hypothetical protein
LVAGRAIIDGNPARIGDVLGVAYAERFRRVVIKE